MMDGRGKGCIMQILAWGWVLIYGNSRVAFDTEEAGICTYWLAGSLTDFKVNTKCLHSI